MRNETRHIKEIATSHKGHMWLMAIFCGVPTIGFLAIAALSVSLPSLELALLVTCTIGMTGMMYMMNRDSWQKSKNDAGKISVLSPNSLKYKRISAEFGQAEISQAKKSTRGFDA